MILPRHKYNPPDESMVRFMNPEKKVYKSGKPYSFIFKRKVADVIKEETGFDPLINNKCHERDFVESRQLFAAMMRKYRDNITLLQIGNILKRDHATIFSGIKMVNNLKDTNKEFRELYNKIDLKIQNLK
jgi:hypothetical protein